MLKLLKRLFPRNPTAKEIQENLDKRIREAGVGDVTSTGECTAGGKDNIAVGSYACHVRLKNEG